MNRVPISGGRLDDYSGIVSDQLLSEISQLAEKLRGLRIVHLTAAPSDGVAGILKSVTPLMCDIGIDTGWYALSADPSFFHVSKMLRRCIQDGTSFPCDADMDIYLSHNENAANALSMTGVTADLWMVHDFPLLPMLSFMDSCTGVWLCHADTTRPGERAGDILSPYISNYHSIVTSMPEYFPGNGNPGKVVVCPPAIDPLLPGHRPLAVSDAREILVPLGIDPARPFVCRVSRLDYRKEPWGVIDAFRLARKKIPGLQLTLVSVISAKDGPGAAVALESAVEYAENDPDIHVFSDPLSIGDTEVNAFQSGADVIVQNSAGEAFDLDVIEAMWKGRPVIGGNCGGARLQVRDGVTGYLVNDVESCAERIIRLLKDPTLGELMGNAAREWVRKHYLMPRLLRDYLKLSVTVLGKEEKICAESAL